MGFDNQSPDPRPAPRPFFAAADRKANRGYAFPDKIDDVRIYNRALSDEEVKALYDLEKPKAK